MKIEYDGNFRERWKKRRELAVAIIATVAAGECIETEFERLKAASCYDRLSQQDQANFRRFCSDLRTVWTGWSRLRPDEREAFLSNRTVYSTLAAEIRLRLTQRS